MTKNKKVRLWIYQTNLSGNANGHFEVFEGEVNSTKQDIINYCKSYYWKCFNIKNLGVFNSGIGNRTFPTDSYLRKFKSI